MLITRLCLTRLGLRRFTSEVNAAMQDGFRLSEVKFDKRGPRILCVAILEKPPSPPDGLPDE